MSTTSIRNWLEEKDRETRSKFERVILCIGYVKENLTRSYWSGLYEFLALSCPELQETVDQIKWMFERDPDALRLYSEQLFFQQSAELQRRAEGIAETVNGISSPLLRWAIVGQISHWARELLEHPDESSPLMAPLDKNWDSSDFRNTFANKLHDMFRLLDFAHFDAIEKESLDIQDKIVKSRLAVYDGVYFVTNREHSVRYLNSKPEIASFLLGALKDAPFSWVSDDLSDFVLLRLCAKKELEHLHQALALFELDENYLESFLSRNSAVIERDGPLLRVKDDKQLATRLADAKRQTGRWLNSMLTPTVEAREEQTKSRDEGAPVVYNETYASKREEPTPQSIPSSAFGNLHIALGSTPAGEMVDLAFNEKLTNPNIMIVGETGSGKTTTIRTILHALVQQNVPFFVLDLEDSFVDYANVKIDIKNSASKSINPLEIDSETVTPYDNAQQIRDIIASIFPELGDWQKSFLLNAIMDSYVKAGFIRNEAGQHTRRVPSFNTILENLIARQEDASPAEKRQIEGIKVRLDPVFEYDIFSKPHTLSFTEVSKKRVAVLLRNLLSDELKALVISFFLKKILNFYQMQPEVESGQIRSFVVIDETHRLSAEEGAPLEVGLRQLRKRGVGFVLASQFPRDFEKNPAISGNIETRIAHKCEDDHAKAAAALVSTKAEMSPNLTREILSLNKGEAILRHKNDQGGTSTERVRIVFEAPV